MSSFLSMGGQILGKVTGAAATAGSLGGSAASVGAAGNGLKDATQTMADFEQMQEDARSNAKLDQATKNADAVTKRFGAAADRMNSM